MKWDDFGVTPTTALTPNAVLEIERKLHSTLAPRVLNDARNKLYIFLLNYPSRHWYDLHK